MPPRPIDTFRPEPPVIVGQPVAQEEPCHTVVLDTNVVLDLWFFADPRVTSLRHAVERGHVKWIITSALQDEIVHVLSQANTVILSRVGANTSSVFEALDRWARPRATSAPAAHAGLRCTDTDDQKFIDLALCLAPAWLLSRDRAVLKIARRAAAHGVRIATPEHWATATTGAP